MRQAAGRFVRVAETETRARLTLSFDGERVSALEGDTVLTALLTARRSLRKAEFGPEHRAGFCLMGACQDCWVWQEDGVRLQACRTPVREGMRLRSRAPDRWPDTAAERTS